MGGIVQLPSVQVNSVLPTYRAIVEAVVEEAARYPSDLPVIERLVTKWLGQPELSTLLSHVDGGADVAADCLLRELRSYRPDGRSAASDLPTFIRVLLLSQIDSVWWGGTKSFVSDADVHSSTELVDLGPLTSAKKLAFQYRAQPTGLTGRARDWMQHKVRRESVLASPGCASHARDPLLSPWLTRSRANSPQRYRRARPGSGSPAWSAVCSISTACAPWVMRRYCRARIAPAMRATWK